MKRILYILSLLVLVTSCYRQDSYVIHGRLRCVRSNIAYLMEMDPLGNVVVVDSVAVRGGEFRFKGHVDYPTMRFVKLGTRTPFDVFVENSDIRITGSMQLPDEIKIEGSTSHNDFLYMTKMAENFQNKRNAVLLHLASAKKRKDAKEIATLSRQFRSYPDSLLLSIRSFVEEHPTSVGAAYYLCSLSQEMEISKIEPVVSLFDSSIEPSPYVQYLKAEVSLHKRLTKGMQAPAFSLPTFLNDTVRLSDYAGSYLFLDFGASWCDETMDRVNKLLVIHEMFHDKGFDVLNISMDPDRREWREHVVDMGVLPWKQACDLLYWSSPVSKFYSVQMIPYGVLIDPQGRIVKVNPSMGELNSYMKKVFR